MAVTIQDDMLEAAGQMSRKDGDAFLLALLAYGATGVEPKGRPSWLPTFTACKGRIAMSEEGRKKAKAMAKARWDKKNAAADAQASCTSTTHEQDAAADAQAGSLDEMRLDEMRCDEASDARTRARAREAEGWCMDGRQEGFRVLDSSGKGHHVPSDSLRATYAARHGSDAGFARVRQAMSRPRCAGCGRDEESVIACHNTARDALVRWDRPLDGDPSKIVRKMLAEDVDANA